MTGSPKTGGANHEFVFQPFSEKQKQLMFWYREGSPWQDCDMVIADGAIRSGKTIAMLCGFFLWSIHSFDAGNFILAGKTISALKRNVIGPALQILRAWGVRYHYVSTNDMRLEIGGLTYYLYDADNERSQDRLQGLTACGALADEVALFPRSFVEQMIGRCSAAGAKIWMNCNPENPQHFVKTELIDRAAEKHIAYFHFLMSDNRSLSPETVARNERMFSGVFYQRFIQGLWVQTEGLVYDMFEPEKHVVDAAASDLTAARFWVSCDYGTLNPCVFGLWALGPEGNATMVKEYYWNAREKHRQKTDEEYYADLEAFIGDYPVEAILVDPSAASFKATIRHHGRFRVKDGRNTVLDGIRLTGSLLAAGRLHFDRSCTATLREFRLYSWDEDAPADTVRKEHDHSMDQLRYFCSTIMRKELHVHEA